MKYRKPAEAIQRFFDRQEGWTDEANLRAFLDSLPAEFTILEEAWPKELTRESLTYLADKIDIQIDAEHHWPAQSRALRALAAIAPGPRKRKVELWKSVNGHRQWGDAGTVIDNINWRKVGECEIEEG